MYFPSLDDATKIYPGDDVVDVVGVDAYGWKDSDAVDGPGGITQWMKFARDHGKRFALPEWGVHSGADGAGDNPEFVARVMTALKADADNVAYASYFDEPEPPVANSVAIGQAPRAADELRSQLG